MLQTKKQGKNTQEQINEDEIGNVPEKEFSSDSKNDSRGFPGDSLATCQCRRHRLVPWFRKIPHAMRQIRPCATTIEPML